MQKVSISRTAIYQNKVYVVGELVLFLSQNIKKRRLKEAKIRISARWSAHVVLNVQSMYMKRKVFYKTKTETYDVIQSTRIENSSNDTRKIKQGQSPFQDRRWAFCPDWTLGFRQILEIDCAQLCCRGFYDYNWFVKIIKRCEKHVYYWQFDDPPFIDRKSSIVKSR